MRARRGQINSRDDPFVILRGARSWWDRGRGRAGPPYPRLTMVQACLRGGLSWPQGWALMGWERVREGAMSAVVVTGAAKGIGEAVALRLAAEGGPLVAVEMRGEGFAPVPR